MNCPRCHQKHRREAWVRGKGRSTLRLVQFTLTKYHPLIGSLDKCCADCREWIERTRAEFERILDADRR